MAPVACAQDDAESTPTEIVEQYMAERGLSQLLSAHLLDRIAAAQGPERAALAQRVSRLQADLFERASTPEAEAAWESQTQKLVSLVPEAESGELRVKLARVRYYRVERVAEQHVLRLVAPEDAARARGELKALAATFNEVGLRAMRSIDTLDRRLETARDEDARALRDDIGRARALHASAMYFAGWASLYAAMLSVDGAQRDGETAEQALVQFGYVLNAPTGRAALVDRAGDGRLRADYAARAALACAVAEAIRGRDDTAVRWLDAVEAEPDVPGDVASQVWHRRLLVLAWTRRWPDLEYLVQRRRDVRDGVPSRPLPTEDARLLAILGMEAQRDGKTADERKRQARALADAAMADLIAAGELRHVTDLAARYSDLTLPGTADGAGFLPAYIRGSQLYDRAHAAHGAEGRSAADEPTKEATTANLYRDAAASLQRALGSADAERFRGEFAAAQLMAGLSLYFAGDLEEAAAKLERVFVDHPGTPQALDGLWMAILATDRLGQQGRGEQSARLSRLAALFLKTYPTSERAVKLLVSRAGSTAATPEQAAELLLGITADSPLYEQARRQAANLLYQLFRDAPAGKRAAAAGRMVPVAEEALRIERRLAAAADAGGSREAMSRVVLRCRQLLDATLGVEPPDVARAEATLQLVESLTADAGRSAEPEIVFRRMQLALAKGLDEEARRASDRLRGLGGPFAARADRVMFNRALSQVQGGGAGPEVHRELVICGERIVESFTPGTAEDARNAAVLDAVAASAAVLWRTGDEGMAAVALRLDERLARLESPPVTSLVRHAEMLEARGDAAAALDLWRRLVGGLDPRGEPWMRARFESLRILAATEPERAREALAQLRVLRPEVLGSGSGPEPWITRLRELDRALGLSAPAKGGSR